jgi:hypothetical protein
MTATASFLMDALGKLAQDMLDREQTHLVVNAETGEITLREQLSTRTWANWVDVPDWCIPAHGRLWIHVE